MNYNLPTKEECDNIVKNNKSFYKTETIVEGQNVVFYDYRLVTINDFKDNKDFELRGLTFVEQSDGSWKRNILLNKFFNVNKTEVGSLEDLKDKNIEKIQEKLDDSVISFVQFDNGVIKAKSKMSFTSKQAILAQKFYNENHTYREFVEDCFTSYLTPIFELIAFENQIVVNYEEPFELRLLQIRRDDGTYLPLEKLNRFAAAYELKCSDTLYSEDITLDDLETDFQDAHKKDKIIEMTNKVSKNFNHLVTELKDLYDKFVTEYKGDKRRFVIENKDNFLFNSVMNLLKRPKKLEEKDFENEIKNL